VLIGPAKRVTIDQKLAIIEIFEDLPKEVQHFRSISDDGDAEASQQTVVYSKAYLTKEALETAERLLGVGDDQQALRPDVASLFLGQLKCLKAWACTADVTACLRLEDLMGADTLADAGSFAGHNCLLRRLIEIQTHLVGSIETIAASAVSDTVLQILSASMELSLELIRGPSLSDRQLDGLDLSVRLMPTLGISAICSTYISICNYFVTNVDAWLAAVSAGGDSLNAAMAAVSHKCGLFSSEAIGSSCLATLVEIVSVIAEKHMVRWRLVLSPILGFASILTQHV
jgi:hypothetical protein